MAKIVCERCGKMNCTECLDEQRRQDAEYDDADPEAMHDRDGKVALEVHESTTTNTGGFCLCLVLAAIVLLGLVVAACL